MCTSTQIATHANFFSINCDFKNTVTQELVQVLRERFRSNMEQSLFTILYLSIATEDVEVSLISLLKGQCHEIFDMRVFQ
jgi:hypothetical protein